MRWGSSKISIPAVWLQPDGLDNVWVLLRRLRLSGKDNPGQVRKYAYLEEQRQQ
jgi:hypothetical protein